MSVKEIKEVLSKNNIDFSNCVEKEDLIYLYSKLKLQ